MSRLDAIGCRAWPLRLGMVATGVLAVVVGCSPGGPAGKGEATGAGGSKSAGDLSDKIGDYLPPLDGGRLEIAPPKGWNWANPGGGVLVAFKPQDIELNKLPRILLTVADAGLLGMDDVTAENVAAFVSHVSDAAADKKLRAPVQATTIAGRQFATYQILGKRRNQVVIQHFLATIVEGREYRLQLDAYQADFAKVKSTIEVVASSMKFPTKHGESSDSPREEAASVAAKDVPQDQPAKPTEQAGDAPTDPPPEAP